MVYNTRSRDRDHDQWSDCSTAEGNESNSHFYSQQSRQSRQSQSRRQRQQHQQQMVIQRASTTDSESSSSDEYQDHGKQYPGFHYASENNISTNIGQHGRNQHPQPQPQRGVGRSRSSSSSGRGGRAMVRRKSTGKGKLLDNYRAAPPSLFGEESFNVGTATTAATDDDDLKHNNNYYTNYTNNNNNNNSNNNKHRADAWLYLLLTSSIAVGSLSALGSSSSASTASSSFTTSSYSSYPYSSGLPPFIRNSSLYVGGVTLTGLSVGMSAAASVVWRVESARRWIGFDRVHRLELAMTILAVLLWIAAMPVLLDGKNYMATRGTSVENANVFFSTWASFGLVTFLLASVVSEACFNVVGGGGGASSGNIIGSGSGMNNHRRTILWISMFFFANAVLGSSLSLYSSPICQGMLSSSRMCASSMVTIVTSILTNVLCFMALTLSYVMHSRLKKHAARQSSSSSSSSSQPWALSTKQSMKLQSQSKTTNKITSLLAIASLTIQSVGTTYVTSPGGMGFVSGNLFLSSWSCTILAFLLCLDYVNHVYLDAVVSGGSSGRYGAPVKQALHFSYNGNTTSMHSTSMATSIGNITDSTSTAYDTEEELVEDVHHHHPAIAAPFSEGISMAETETEASASVVPDARGSVNGQHFGSSGVPLVPASQIGLQPDASAIEEEQFEVPANRGYGYYHHPSQGVGQDPEPEQQDVGYDASTEFGNVESMASFTPSFQGAEANGRKYNLKASLTRDPSFYSEHPDGGGIMSVLDSEMGGTRSKSTKSSRSSSSSKRSSSKNKAKGDKPLQHHNGGGRKNKNAKASAEASGMKYNLKASMYADEAVLSISESEMTSSTKSPSFNRPAVKRTREQQPSRYPPPPPPSQRTNDNTKRETFIVPTFKPKTGSFTSYQGNAQSSYVSVPSFNSAPHPVPPPPPRSKASKSVSTTSSSGTTPRTVDERSTGTHLTETDHSGPLTETDHSGPIQGKNNRIHGSAESWSTGLEAKSSSDVSSRRPTSKSPARKSPGRNHPSQSSSRSPRAMRPRTPQPPPRPVNEPVMPAAVAAAYQPRRGTIKSRRQDQGDFNKSSKILSSESITHGLYDPMQSKTISLEDSDSIISDPTMDGSIMTSRQKGVVREKQVNHAVAAALAHAEVFKKSSTSNISMRKSTKSGTAGPDVDKIVAAAIAAATSKTNLTSSQISWRNSSTTSRAKSHAPPLPPPKPHEQSQGEEKSTDIEFDKSAKSIHSFYSNFVHSKASSKASSASLTNSDFGFDC